MVESYQWHGSLGGRLPWFGHPYTWSLACHVLCCCRVSIQHCVAHVALVRAHHTLSFWFPSPFA